MEFFQVDVFADAPYRGNPLAVFPDPADLTTAQMQAIAREMNLSETTFVSFVERDRYRLRIFTPGAELPFAGHPTLGSAWLLRRLGRLDVDDVVQVTAAGETRVRFAGDDVWFTRPGTVEPDLEDADPGVRAKIARALALDAGDVGLEARELGRAGFLRPAFADAGFRCLIAPVASLDALRRCEPAASALAAVAADGAYCFSAEGAGRLRARGFFPGVAVDEDPGTGAAAAALGIYLADRVGDIDAEVVQGVEIARPSRIAVRARAREVHVGGRCEMIFTGRLERLPV